MQIKKIIQKLKPNTKRLLGIDIHTNLIRLVELSYSGLDNYQVEACVNIAKNFELMRFKTKNAAIALAHSVSIFKEIKITASLTDEEIEDFLQFNMEKYIGESANNLSFDYHIIKQATNATTDEQTIVRLTAVRREHVEKQVKLLRMAGFCPKVVDVNSYALERVVRRQFKNISGLLAIINIDDSAILIVVIDQEKIVYVHEDVINADQAQTVAQIVMQLKLKMPLVFAAFHQPVEKIILAGEQSILSKLSEEVAVQFDLQTIIINPFVGMKLSSGVSQDLLRRIAPTMMISCGLALRVADGD